MFNTIIASDDVFTHCVAHFYEPSDEIKQQSLTGTLHLIEPISRRNLKLSITGSTWVENISSMKCDIAPVHTLENSDPIKHADLYSDLLIIKLDLHDHLSYEKHLTGANLFLSENTFLIGSGLAPSNLIVYPVANKTLEYYNTANEFNHLVTKGILKAIINNHIIPTLPVKLSDLAQKLNMTLTELLTSFVHDLAINPHWLLTNILQLEEQDIAELMDWFTILDRASRHELSVDEAIALKTCA